MLVVLGAAGYLAGAWLLGRVAAPGTSTRPAAAAGTRVSVVVPARNEAGNLPTLLDSLARSEHAIAEVIVVDDGSTDDTAAVANKHGATVVTAPPPPLGWAGKPWACQLGADAATGTHLLFLDADTWLAPDAVDRLLAEHAEHGGLVSVQPAHDAGPGYEQLSAYCNLVVMAGTGAFARTPPADLAIAFGACILTSAADYARVGGHAAVKDEVVEDVRLAGRYRDAGLPVTCFAGRDAVRFRMYPGGPRQLVEGWSKNMASGASDADRLAVIGAVVFVTAHVAIATRAVVGTAQWLRGSGRPPLLAFVGWVVAAVQLRVLLGRVGRFRRWTSTLFPLPLAAFLGLFARSALLTLVRREVAWRGRRLPVPIRRGAR